jgi:hypothetical protein
MAATSLNREDSGTVVTLRLVLFGTALLAASHALSATTYHVDRFDDPSPIPSSCSTPALDCSLRGAIVRANVAGELAVVKLPVGTFTLTLAGASEDASQSGDLDITAPLRIVGEGSSRTLISAASLGDRVLDMLAPDVTGSSIEGVTLAFGEAGIGGGVRCLDGNLKLLDVQLAQNDATDSGGGLAVLPGCEVAAHGLQAVLNDAVNDGGGVYLEGVLELHRSQLRFNDSGLLGGGLASRGGFAYLFGVAVAGNEASSGGGLFIGPRSGISGFLQLEDSTVADNVANFGAGLRLSQVGVQVRHATFAAQGGGDGRALYASGVSDASAVTFSWNSLFDAPCLFFNDFAWLLSQGGNVEVESATCQLVHAADQDDVSAADADLLPLGDYGGATQTVALGPDSVARHAAPASCTPRDQRRAPRAGFDCDSGAYEAVPGFLFADDFESGGAWFWSELQD